MDLSAMTKILLVVLFFVCTIDSVVSGKVLHN